MSQAFEDAYIPFDESLRLFDIEDYKIMNALCYYAFADVRERIAKAIDITDYTLDAVITKANPKLKKISGREYITYSEAAKLWDDFYVLWLLYKK